MPPAHTYYRSHQGYKEYTLSKYVKWGLVLATGGVFGLLLFWSQTVRGWFRTETTDKDAELFMVGKQVTINSY